MGEPRILQGLDSDVSLHIPEECPGIYTTLVHTDLTSKTHLIPEDECFISPPVEATFYPLKKHTGEQTPRKKCALKIPHCL